MAMGLFSVKCCALLFVCLWMGVGQSEAGLGPIARLERLFRPLPPPPPPPPPPQAYFYPQPGPITSILPPFIHGYGTPLYEGTKFVVARNHPALPPPSHLHDPDLVRFFYHQAPTFFNIPSLNSLYTIPHAPPTFFDYPGGFGSFEKYTGPATTIYKEEPAPAVVSEGGYGAPPVTVTNDEYEPPSTGGYGSGISGGYGSSSNLGGYDSSSGGYSSSSGGVGGYDSSSGGYESNSGGYNGPSGGSSSNANAHAGSTGPGPAGANPTGSQNQAPFRTYEGGKSEETGPSGRASSDRQEDTRPRPAGAGATAGANENNQNQSNQSDSDFQDEPDVGFRSLTSGSFRRPKPKEKEKGNKVASSGNDEEYDESEPTKDPFKSSPFLSQFIDSSQYQKKQVAQKNEEADGPIQFRSPLSDSDLFDYGDELINTAAGGERNDFRQQTQAKQRKNNEVASGFNKDRSSKQNGKKKLTNSPNQDQVFFDEIDDRRNGAKGDSSKEDLDPKPTVDYDQVGTTGASDSAELGSKSAKPTPTSAGYESTSQGSSSSSTSTSTDGGYDDAKPTGGYDEDITTTAKNGSFGTKIRPTPTSSSSKDRENSNRQKKSPQSRHGQRPRQ